MRILLVGASGLLGRAVAGALSARHEVIGASRSDEQAVDLNDSNSIAALYERVGMVDAVACTAGVTPFAPITDLSVDQYRAGVTDKLLGQIALVLLGMGHVRDAGSFTLISGVLADDPITTGTVAGTVNGGIQAFVRSAAIELPRGQRINTVSPTVFTEAWETYGDYFPGFPPVAVAEAARAYVKSVEGAQTGQVYRVGYLLRASGRAGNVTSATT
jgi:NAD(P)-dependent dehydrogenase (short-subunit alcohol dehydrogenase family)